MLVTFDGQEDARAAAATRDEPACGCVVRGVTGPPAALGIVEDASRWAAMIACSACAADGVQNAGAVVAAIA